MNEDWISKILFVQKQEQFCEPNKRLKHSVLFLSFLTLVIDSPWQVPEDSTPSVSPND